MKRKRDRYFEIAAEHSANLRFITILTSEDLRGMNMRGRSTPQALFMMVRRPDTLYWLWRFLHECAHCKLHQSVSAGTPYHWIELDAERYVLEALASAGIEVNNRLLIDSQNYIFGELSADLRAGFDPATDVFEYLNMSEQRASEFVVQMRALPQTNQFLRNSPGSWGSRQWAQWNQSP
jgi:hypothetical protein